MIAARAGLAQIWEWLAEVPDPEIPVLSIVDLGIVREVGWVDGDAARSDALRVVLTPTYSGCPATRVIERDVVRALHERGIERVELSVRIAPPWTTDWLSGTGREKLRAYGISPPGRADSRPLDLAGFREPDVVCPRCGASDAELTSRFGSTPCKALYRCKACREPFDHFKCH